MTKYNSYAELKEPLTKGDFIIHQFENQIGLYSIIIFFTLFLGVILAGQAIYHFIAQVKYYGIDRLIGSVFFFILSKKLGDRYSAIRHEYNKIKKFLEDSTEN